MAPSDITNSSSGACSPSPTPRIRLRLFDVASCFIASNNDEARHPPRPYELRQDGYERFFDYKTVFYDAVRVSGDTAVLIGPPLLNLKAYLDRGRVLDADSGHNCTTCYKELNRYAETWVSIFPDTRALIVDTALGVRRLELSDDKEAFKGRRVIFTVSRDNELIWIKDWMRFYRDVHGADGMILFENNSKTYSSQQLKSAVSEVEGFKSVAIVRWPYLWGPTAGKGKRWDSNYGQHGAFGVARWRFLQQAYGVCNCDIDELVVPEREGGDVFSEADNRGGVVFYGSVWTVRDVGQEVKRNSYRQHKDYQFSLRTDNKLQNLKYTLIPSKLGNPTQWQTHAIKGVQRDVNFSEELRTRHFMEINTSWKWNRKKAYELDDPELFKDDSLLRAFSGVRWDR